MSLVEILPQGILDRDLSESLFLEVQQNKAKQSSLAYKMVLVTLDEVTKPASPRNRSLILTNTPTTKNIVDLKPAQMPTGGHPIDLSSSHHSIVVTHLGGAWQMGLGQGITLFLHPVEVLLSTVLSPNGYNYANLHLLSLKLEY